MKKLSKEQLAERTAWLTQLSDKRDDVEAAIADFNAVVANANEWLQSLAEQASDYLGERSDRWQESDAGQSYDSWASRLGEEIEEIDEVDFDELLQPLAELPESPDEV